MLCSEETLKMSYSFCDHFVILKDNTLSSLILALIALLLNGLMMCPYMKYTKHNGNRLWVEILNNLLQCGNLKQFVAVKVTFPTIYPLFLSLFEALVEIIFHECLWWPLSWLPWCPKVLKSIYFSCSL